MRYQIVLRGRLSGYRQGWFSQMAVTHDAAGNTRLEGELADQPALFGVLEKIRDLGCPLIEVKTLPEEATNDPHKTV